ncbi:GH92 family glycosyl hydrolase [Granulicella tundricola]|uniref:Alpha-1,2-mannosidase n=1 Tax=Granulicella tundricola (strain ATCC BAA-1859 / DSM 23138 / MP5ACTX9) TaxID=1198114 RepID=E8X698_GRATM|nr:GH92 family glycosyl hydrolase [Granulicella tundricola]ADW70982.1 alpha-1,2-mannosidase [Granulicella tundricola MP5ACTX9]
MNVCARLVRIVCGMALVVVPAGLFAQASGYEAVNPFIGTGADGHTYPGATVPFGMVQLSPDTQINSFKHSYKWAAGYRYEDGTILGFSHTHFSGAGHSDLGDFLVQPISGEVRLEPGDANQPGSGYRSGFSHATEVAKPGYYAVTLADYGVRAELTATARVGVHRYTFPAGKPAHVLMDMRSSIYSYPGKVLWSRLRVRNDGTVTGMRETRGWAPGRQLYFAMKFSVPMATHEIYDKEPLPVEYRGFKTPGNNAADTQAMEGRGLIGVFDFGEMKGPLVVKVALSPTSEDEAMANLNAEVAGFDFDAVHAQAKATWEKALGAVQLTAAPDMRTNLYTALYHALLAPGTAMDVDGSYRGPDNQVHHADGFHFVSSLSLWDTYRAEQPLMTLLEPEARTTDLVRSLMASQQESPFGMLPVWQFQGIETWCMIGYHAVPEIADAVMKGIGGFDANKALDAMVATADYAPYGHLGEYMKLGYVPIDISNAGTDGSSHDESVSQTIEYAYDDWTIARVARKLGRNDVAVRFEKRAGNWKNVFDTADGFSEPRKADGSWRVPFNPAKAGAGSGFTEGNSWQYSWYQPQDEAGLIKLLGGDEKLVAKLDAMFNAKVDPKDYADVEDMAGLIGQYVHGNEPSHHLAYLYAYAGQPWRVQERLKQIVESQYKPAPDGLVGNDDLGQMSAWLLFTGLGFYPVAPGTNEYVIGRPFVERAVLKLPNGRSFTVVADGMSAEHPYVGSVTLDGKALTRSFVTHEEIMRGGELRFVMSGTANKSWGSGSGARPYSMSR